MFHLAKDVEESCPHCPFTETGQFIEHMYRAGHGTWEQLEEYVGRLKAYRDAVIGCCSWVKITLAKLGRIPEHHVVLLCACDGEVNEQKQN